MTDKLDELLDLFLAPTDKVLRLAIQYGQLDGAHHKAWVIDQMVRELAGNLYDELIVLAKDGHAGPDTYEWDVGIPP